MTFTFCFCSTSRGGVGVLRLVYIYNPARINWNATHTHEMYISCGLV